GPARPSRRPQHAPGALRATPPPALPSPSRSRSPGRRSSAKLSTPGSSVGATHRSFPQSPLIRHPTFLPGSRIEPRSLLGETCMRTFQKLGILGVSIAPFLFSCTAAPGTSGLDGIPSESDPPGVDGAPGAPGANGVDGADGSPGPKGTDGRDGADG